MKYRVENQLDIFEFHDSIFSLVSYNGKDLIVSVKHLNIHKTSEQNPYEYDMEIECAKIIFKGFYASSYDFDKVWQRDEDGNFHLVNPGTVLKGKEAEDKIIQELQNQIGIYSFCQLDDARYSIDGFGIEPFFKFEFYFDSVIVEWDEYCKKAWYELSKQYQYEMTLDTPIGEQTFQVHIVCHYKGEYPYDDLETSTVTVCIKYDGKEYRGRGSKYLWVDAFADLQKQLPSGVLLKCCLTCRHGNLCPVGNCPNELFCTKDVTLTIEQFDDLYFYTVDDAEREKRSRQYTSVCEEYEMQSDKYFTYNDYLHYLSKT